MIFSRMKTPSYPPSLSDSGKLHLLSKKSDLLTFLEPTDSGVHIQHRTPRYWIVPLIAHSLQAASTFNEYADGVFIPFVLNQASAKTSKRVDIVWDTYVTDSLKESTRE